MEDSLKGILVTLTIAGLFIVAILNFAVMFPQEQGASFSDEPSQNNYLTTSANVQSMQNNVNSQLTSNNNASTEGFNQWDITQGFMGSNTIKQTSSGGISSYFSLIFNNLKILATQIFGSNSPVLYVLTVLMTLGIGYLIWAVYKFVRTGN